MNLLHLALIAAMAVSAAQTASAQSTAQKGNTEAHTELGLTEGGTNSGGADKMIRSSIQFTADLASNLDKVKGEAQILWDDGSQVLALKTLRDGVEQAVASASKPEHKYGLTFRNVNRLLTLTSVLEKVNASMNAQSAIYLLYFGVLSKNVKFDRETYIGFGSGLKAVKVDQVALAAGLDTYVRNFLVQAYDALTFEGRNTVYPRFSAEVYTSSMSAILTGIAQDLEKSPLADGSTVVAKAFYHIKSEFEAAAEGNKSQPDALAEIARTIKTLKEGK